MLKNILYSLSLSLTLLFAASACTDELDIDKGYIGKGFANVDMTVSFHPLIAAETATGRAVDGDVLSDLNDIAVFVYDINDNLYNIYSGEDLVDLKVYDKDKTGANNATAPDVDGEKAEGTTAKATFTLKNIPFGRYSFYAVANMGEFKNDEATRAKFAKSADLKKLTVKWDEGNIAANDQMFGFFTTPDDEESQGFDAPQLPINQTRVSLHAWVQRAASKITLVFDGSGLFDNIWIYVKKVTVKDIPRYCKIGEYNGVYTKVGEKDSLIVEGDCINYNQAGALPGNEEPSVDYKKWLEISRGSGKKGAVEVDEKGDSTFHSEYAQALFFYENMQGNYENDPNKKFYDKTPDWDEVGTIPGPDDTGYKDNVPRGTYIEVEAYYNSTNANQVSQGRIIYRFMLGQNDTYDYNAIRNHHYKITLGFKGYANQPDWHIAYIEPERTIFTDPTYYISYQYNQKAIFPIRIKGDITKVEAEIVENNWAPFDSTRIAVDGYPVPKGSFSDTDPMSFKWNRTVYINSGKQNVTTTLGAYANGSSSDNASTENLNYINKNGYYYGLQRPYSSDGKTRLANGYTAKEIEKGAPEYATPIWAGFLALQVPDGTLDAVTNDGVDYRSGCSTLRSQYYDGKQNIRTFSSEDLKKSIVGTGNNQCEITHAEDGSITLHLPMWTRPKSFLGISGFSGNNPYDTYQRRAIVKLTFTYSDGKKIVRYKPVYQVRRVVNPKAVWRRWNDNTTFHVVLSRREGADAQKFTGFTSEGAWRARVKTTNGKSFISLSGGQSGSGGEIYGETGSKVEFDINFTQKAENADPNESMCAIVEIEYHGFTCRHTIFVRQGYNTPLQIVPGGKKWSSFALYKCWGNNAAFGTQWDATNKNYIDAELTASPLALGTFFKRGNYNGILIKNNKTYGVTVPPGQSGTFEMASSGALTWKEMQGYPVTNSYGGWTFVPYGANSIQQTFTWGRFKVIVNGEERHYKLPTYADYDRLHNNCEYGIGVMYGDGAETTAEDVDDAYGFEDFDNTGSDETTTKGVTRGMRGVIVYNESNANQIFFPVGARGVGRRTIAGYTKTSYNRFGELRYSSVLAPLTGATNSFRPIPYNMPASPGALYWFEKIQGDGTPCWDCNYFDMNFTPYSFPVGFTPAYTDVTNSTHGGDALPIKLILDE